MTTDDARETAATAADLPRLFVQFVQAGDFEGLASLYEPDAVLALPPDEQTRGNTAIAEVFRQEFAGRTPGGSGSQLQPVLQVGDLALTSTRMPNGWVTAEIARRQADGSWRWVVDNPSM